MVNSKNISVEKFKIIGQSDGGTETIFSIAMEDVKLGGKTLISLHDKLLDSFGFSSFHKHQVRLEGKHNFVLSFFAFSRIFTK